MELVVTNIGEGVGAVSWWSLPGTVSREELVTACRNAGLATKFIPALPTAQVCLQRALEDVFKDRNTLVKSTRDGFAVLPKGVDADGNPEFKTNITAKLQPQRCEYPDLDINGCSDAYREYIVDAYSRHQKSLSQTELSAMMVALVRQLDGIGLHDRGRMYFIPSTKITEWREYSKAIGSVCALQVFNLPTMKVEEAVNVLGASVQREISESIAEINAAVSAWVEEANQAKANGTTVRKIRSDAMDNKEKEIERLISLSQTYQGILGANLESLKESAEMAHSALMEAYLARM